LQEIGHFGPLLALFAVQFISAFKRFEAGSLLDRRTGNSNCANSERILQNSV